MESRELHSWTSSQLYHTSKLRYLHLEGETQDVWCGVLKRQACGVCSGTCVKCVHGDVVQMNVCVCVCVHVICNEQGKTSARHEDHADIGKNRDSEFVMNI